MTLPHKTRYWVHRDSGLRFVILALLAASADNSVVHAQYSRVPLLGEVSNFRINTDSLADSVVVLLRAVTKLSLLHTLVGAQAQTLRARRTAKCSLTASKRSCMCRAWWVSISWFMYLSRNSEAPVVVSPVLYGTKEYRTKNIIKRVHIFGYDVEYYDDTIISVSTHPIIVLSFHIKRSRALGYINSGSVCAPERLLARTCVENPPPAVALRCLRAIASTSEL